MKNRENLPVMELYSTIVLVDTRKVTTKTHSSMMLNKTQHYSQHTDIAQVGTNYQSDRSLNFHKRQILIRIRNISFLILNSEGGGGGPGWKKISHLSAMIFKTVGSMREGHISSTDFNLNTITTTQLHCKTNFLSHSRNFHNTSPK